MQRYFVKDKIAEQVVLTGDDFHHLVHVMRQKVGDKVLIVDGAKQTVTAEIQEIAEDAVTLKAVAKKMEAKELPVAVTIACGYPKGEKLEWIAQKATELGTAQLVGFPAQASVVKWDHNKLQKKQGRLQKIVKEASEQSHRTEIPAVQLLASFAELLELLPHFAQVLVAYEESSKQGEVTQLVRSLQLAQPGESLLVIFGPEGGLSPQEIAQFVDLGAVLVGLGPRILRTETAPLYFLASCSYQWELGSELWK